ncbi:MAG: polysaccharide biosynthesis tyrosine autokinase [Planctomycetota bacterium]
MKTNRSENVRGATTNAEVGAGEDPVAGLRHVLDLALRRRWALASFGVLGLGLALAWLGAQDPVYRATATVLIDEQDGSSGALSELALFGAAPRASAEIALLSSRGIAEEVVGEPDDGFEAASEAGDRHLELEVEVDDLDRRPITAAIGRLTGAVRSPRIQVRCTKVGEDVPDRIRVRFPRPGTVELASVGDLPYAHLFGSSATELDFEPGRPLEWQGLRLTIDVPGGEEPSGTWLVHHRSTEDAVRSLLTNTRVMETQRNSGVLELTVSDSDPRRAAAKANALCLNYFDLKVQRSRRRASQSISFIETQLEEQTKALQEAEAEVVALRKQYPDLIDLTTSAGRMVEQLSSFEVERLRLDLARRALDEALELAQSGDDRGLSQLSAEIADPLSKGLVERLETLGLERYAAMRSDGGPYRTMLQERAATLAGRAAEARLELEALRRVLAAAEEEQPGAFAGLSAAPGTGPTIDPLTLSYLAELGRLQSEREVLASTYTADYPERKHLEQAIAELRSRLVANLEQRADALGELADERDELADAARRAAEAQTGRDLETIDAALVETRERIASHLAARKEALLRQHTELDRVCSEIEAQLGELPDKERQLAAPLRRLETHKELTALLLKSLQEAQIARASALSSADFVDRASVPDRRYAPRIGFSLALGLLAGLVAGLGLLLVREQLVESLETEADLEAATGLPVLASVPNFREGNRAAARVKDFVALRDDPSGPVAEAYRSLRASLRFAVGDLDQVRTIAVTSSAPSEGKSTTNVDLAWSLASPSRRVLLVDADLRRPSVHRYLGLGDDQGLAECLVGDADWRERVQASGRDQLDVLVAGRSELVSADLLGSDAMNRLVDEWLGTYDVVVFDLPPALVVADVEVFAHRLDAVILLYRAGGLPARAVENTAKRLRSAGANLVGLVMNACRPEKAKGAGAYGDYYKARSKYYSAAREEPSESTRRRAG